MKRKRINVTTLRHMKNSLNSNSFSFSLILVYPSRVLSTILCFCLTVGFIIFLSVFFFLPFCLCFCLHFCLCFCLALGFIIFLSIHLPLLPRLFPLVYLFRGPFVCLLRYLSFSVYQTVFGLFTSLDFS